MENSQFYGEKYVPEHKNVFKHKNVINFAISHHQYRGHPLTKTEKDHKTVCTDDFKNYPKDEKSKVISSIFRSKQDDLLVKRNLMIEHFKKKF